MQHVTKPHFSDGSLCVSTFSKDWYDCLTTLIYNTSIVTVWPVYATFTDVHNINSTVLFWWHEDVIFRQPAQHCLRALNLLKVSDVLKLFYLPCSAKWTCITIHSHLHAVVDSSVVHLSLPAGYLTYLHVQTLRCHVVFITIVPFLSELWYRYAVRPSEPIIRFAAYS